MTKGGEKADTALSSSTELQNEARVSQRSKIDSFIVMDVMRVAAKLEQAGKNVIHMEVGQPSTPAPKRARKQLSKALDCNTLGYTLALGMWPLRERIAKYYRDTHNLSIKPERVVITTGSSGAFVLAFLALFDVGARVGLPSPGYPCYRQILQALGQRPVSIPTGPDDRWMPSSNRVADLMSGPGLDGLILASPANPTGTMIAPERLKEICELCASNAIWFISDEIYHGLSYETSAESALRYFDDAIIINSFSKYYSMTGWRVGWMVVPQRIVGSIERLAQNLYISAPAPAQVAALAAFDAQEELEANRAVYAKNRSYFLENLPKLGLREFSPADGAFYLYCDVSHLTDDSLQFAHAMLNEIGIATTPGIDFDPDHGNRFFTFLVCHEPSKCRRGTGPDAIVGAACPIKFEVAAKKGAAIIVARTPRVAVCHCPVGLNHSQDSRCRLQCCLLRCFLRSDYKGRRRRRW